MIIDTSLIAKREAFAAMERKHRLFSFRVDGWSAWRVLRNPVYRKLENIPLAQPSRSPVTRSIEAIVATFSFAWFLIRGGAPELLIRSCRSGLRIKVNQSFRDIYFDGLLTDGRSYFKMEEINSPDFDEQAGSALRPSDLNPVVFTFWGRILGTLFPLKVDSFCRSTSELLRDALGLHIEARFLRLRISTTYWQARLYEILLARIRPQIILVSDTGEYALRIAAHRKGIPFLELQHGVFDADHPDAIPDWVPGSAADLVLPDALASRGRYWIDRLVGTHQGGAAAVPVGNEFIDEARSRRGERLASKDIRLVLTSQGLDTSRLALWIEAMVIAAPAELNWKLSIKLHPVYDQNTSDFAALTTDERITVIEGAELPNIFDLLVDGDLHLSIASACHFDAVALGLRTVIIPLMGHEMLLPSVDESRIFVAERPADVWRVFKLPTALEVEETHRFSEPGFLANMEKLLVELKEARAPSRRRISDAEFAAPDV
ncbi:hypothetical protein [Bradyrhizobium centrosematis]|uniref:hypothetical protein n=1 Tax=Bradyrhizobium centrosematis TaxID=1300039 RepID=UPI00216AB19B|nr:hypothetical protein [Bradyrhizobium centrosematis]MCS3765324.1 hypothetical protein [Bradyrhizobium centrosematis]MCS3773976.1 hypothetical protein [Bradyrhizobium centrosematis]